MFGPRFEFRHQIGSCYNARFVKVIMRPSNDTAADAATLATNLQRFTTTQFVTLQGGPTAADEVAFLEHIRTDKGGYLWVVEVVEGEKACVLGTTGFSLTEQHRGSSGILMSDTAWWNKGITRLTHRLRLWYAFEELGLNALDSSYLEGNIASGAALRGTGYIDQGRRYGLRFTAGRWVDEVLVTAYNPRAHALFWPNGDVPSEVKGSTDKIASALEWARKIIDPR